MSLDPRDFEGTEQGVEEEDLVDLSEVLSDAGRYSYSGLVCLSLRRLFSDSELDVPFKKRVLRLMITRLNLPDSVKPVMELIAAGEILNTESSFLEILRTEPEIEDDLSVIVQDMIAIAVQEGLSAGEYDARWRVLIRHVSSILGEKFEDMELYEITVIHCLTREQKPQTDAEKKATRRRERIVKAKRYALIGLATIGGGALIGVTGGLAAPLISSGLISVVGGSAVLTALGGTAGAAAMGTIFGAAGAGLAGYKMNKRVGEIEEFGFGQLAPWWTSPTSPEMNITSPQLDITVCISGWVKDETEEAFTKPWTQIRSSREQYYLRYESSYLLELGRAVEYFMTMALTMVTQEALKYTILSGIVSAIAWPAGLLGLASVIDNPWGVCCRRSAQVGKHLAQILLNREHGRRPVTLIGYSLGARVIFYCLREMSERPNAAGIVQDAILIGAPCTGNPEKWQKISKIVAGNVINGYANTDWLLRFLYRALSMPKGGVAGLRPIEINSHRVINRDLSHIVTGHGDYPEKMGEILTFMGIRSGPSPLTETRSSLDLSSENSVPTLTKSLSETVLSDK